MHNLIIADTSCLILLEKIGKLDLLKDFYSVITITKEIKQEYGSELPDWIIVSKVEFLEVQRTLELQIDKGESSAIALGLENKNSLLLIDERKGRRIANQLGLKIMGTLGILIKAKQAKKIKSLEEEIQKLILSGFRVSESLVKAILEKYD